ncbi:hypothetical protein VA7868_01712 [Vibrio aerogenes CECT 7868]|uniref:Putative zinc-finger domain-containing protein n=1 Tax=Vibrio aerogenes CECT 7868 TaxID=1216006 RepID=A0A1M5YGP6_9VIBR|nr:zf-HC2 domain-containing protein [Vibrio aerogenes]SHI11132.1 hypothetical protein VA7868_01712 [Vibrio aerogenes CECT 7868]
MNCKQATRLLSEQMERSLSAREKIALRVHTAMCAGCNRFGRQMKDLRNISISYVKEKNNNSEK